MTRARLKTKEIYLDYAAATFLDPKAKAVMQPFFERDFANPSALYKSGRKAKAAIENARKTIAGIINARPQEIIFTAGGTESINLAIFGAARHYEKKYRARGHIITSAIEHHAILNSIKRLAGEGWKANLIKVDSQGFVNFDELKSTVRPDTALISIMYANNEIGTIQPISEIGKWIKAQNVKRKAQNLYPILFHTDACQAAGLLTLDVRRLGVDLMTVNGSKIYGPKQTGFLFVKTGINLKPLMYGGGQEQGLRPGTENTAGIVGLAKALDLAQKDREKENLRLESLRNYFFTKLLKNIESIRLNGPDISEKNNQRLANNINFSIPGIEGEALVIYLDSYGISASSGSACDSNNNEPSHVLGAMGRSKKEAKEGIRFTLGKGTKKSDLDYTVKSLVKIIRQLNK